MKLTFVALLLAVPCTVAWASSEAITLEANSAVVSFEAGLAHITPLAPLPRQASVIVSAEAAVRHMVTPRFPQEMRRTRQPGYVRLEVMVADDGHVIAASVLESSNRPFAREALRAVEQWLFRPAATPQPNGRRTVLVPFEFRIFRRLR